MRKDLFKGVVLGAVVSTIVMMTTAVLAGTGVGGVFNLGKVNKVNAATTLKGSAGKNLQVTNSGSGSGIGIKVAAGKAPITVNATAGKATNLNADKLDGNDSSVFQHSCDSGAFLASGYIDSSTITGTFGSAGLLDSYSCLGSVQVRRVSAGLYDVKFANVTTSSGIFGTTYTPRVLATSRSGNDDVADVYTYEDTTDAPGYILTELTNIDPSTGGFVDGPINFVVTDVHCDGIFCALILSSPQHHAGTSKARHENGTAAKHSS